MIELTAEWFVLLSTGLFSLGVLGLLTQTNAIRILMSVELILNGANINFVALGSLPSPLRAPDAAMDGIVFAFLSIALAAAEAAVGLAIFVNLHRAKATVDVTSAQLLRG